MDTEKLPFFSSLSKSRELRSLTAEGSAALDTFHKSD